VQTEVGATASPPNAARRPSGRPDDRLAAKAPGSASDRTPTQGAPSALKVTRAGDRRPATYRTGDQERAGRRWGSPAAAAITHARRGWVLVPLRPGTGLPARKWAHLTCTPPGAIAAWWPGPLYNPGVATGPSGLVVIDLDSAEHGGTLPPEWAGTGVTHGADVLAILAERAGQPVPATYQVLTPRLGRHLYFTAPAGRAVRNSAGRVGPMIDVRGVGGLVVAAGSVRYGRPYELVDDRDPVPLPEWLADLAGRREPPAARAAPARAVTVTRDGYAGAALRSEIAIVLGTGRGGRNDQVNRSAFALGTLVGAGDLAEDEVTAALLSAAGTIGLIADDGTAQCERTIASGLAAGIAQPRDRRAA